jgi:phosphatidate cytidylyltransferase
VKEPAVSEFGLRICSSVVLAALAVLVTWQGGVLYFLFWLAAAVLIVWEWTRLSGYRVGWSASGLIYAAAFLAAMLSLRDSPYGGTAVLWLFGLIWTADSAAYLGGRAIGGMKLWPAVSPGKTWSGAIVGTVAGVAGGLIVLAVAGIPLHVMHAVFGFVVVVAAQLGDLLESSIKRHFGVKDSSRLIPGHGGVMDRCDSLVAASVAAFLLGALRFGHAPAQGLLAW